MSIELITYCRETNLPEEFIPSDLQWLDDIEPTKDFFSWLTNCVSNDNVITPDELQTFETLSKAGKFEEEEDRKANKDDQLELTVDVYPHNRDLEILEDVYRQNQMRLANYKEYLGIINKTELAERTQLESKIEQMLDNEFSEINNYIGGEYRTVALDVGAKLTQMVANLKSISENVNVSNLVSLSSMDKFFNQTEILHLFIVKCWDALQIAMNTSRLGLAANGEYEGSSSIFQGERLDRIFHGCVHLNLAMLNLESEIQGLTEIYNALDRPDLLNMPSEGYTPFKSCTDELERVCFNHVRNEFFKKEVAVTSAQVGRRREIKNMLEKLHNLARPFRLNWESVMVSFTEESKWIRIIRGLVSDSVEALLDIQQQNQKSYRQLINIQSTRALSSTALTLPDASCTMLKLFEVNSTIHSEAGALLGSTWSNGGKFDSMFSSLKWFSDKAAIILSSAQMVHTYIFNGASATFPVDSDLISSVIRISQALNSKEEKLGRLHFRQFEVATQRQNSEFHSLLNKFWLLYIEDPHRLRQMVEDFEARSQQLHRNKRLASKANDIDSLEKFFL